MTAFQSINPFTGKHMHSHHFIGDQHLDEVIDRAEYAGAEWKNKSFEDRAALFLTLAKLIENNCDELAELAVTEMGKPLKEARAEVLKCITACTYYAKESSKLLAPEIHKEDGQREVHIRYEPMGIVLGIFPWNFPFWQIIRSAVPVIMAGNTMLVKPAPNVPQCALKLQQLFDEAGFPSGVIQTIFASEEQIARVIADFRIKACTLTGSERAGAVVAAQAGRHIKHVVLELGGSDPFIVMADADLERAADTAITARFQNNGQSCIAAKRFILHESIYDAFVAALRHRMSQLLVGDPMNPETTIGPMARADLRDKLKHQLDDTVRMGGRIVFQHPGEVHSGFFFPPTLVEHIPDQSPAATEELFGPVLPVFTIRDEAEAIRVANNSRFGLGASVWTADTACGNRIANALECGTVYVNGLVKSNAKYPFGGNKSSGVGRELGAWGIREFCNIKTVWV